MGNTVNSANPLSTYIVALRHQDHPSEAIRHFAQQVIREFESQLVTEVCGCQKEQTGKYFKICETHYQAVMQKVRE